MSDVIKVKVYRVKTKLVLLFIFIVVYFISVFYFSMSKLTLFDAPIVLLGVIMIFVILVDIYDDPLYIYVSKNGLLLKFLIGEHLIRWDEVNAIYTERDYFGFTMFKIKIKGKKVPIIIGGKIENGGRDIIMAYERYVSGKRPIVNSEKGCGRVGHML